jgi:Trk-type K+ transport system membrane component
MYGSCDELCRVFISAQKRILLVITVNIGTTVITTIGTTTKTAPTGATWRHSTGGIVSTTGSTAGCNGTTGIGATVIRTAISENRKRAKYRKLVRGRVVQAHYSRQSARLDRI